MKQFVVYLAVAYKTAPRVVKYPIILYMDSHPVLAHIFMIHHGNVTIR